MFRPDIEAWTSLDPTSELEYFVQKYVNLRAPSQPLPRFVIFAFAGFLPAGMWWPDFCETTSQDWNRGYAW